MRDLILQCDDVHHWFGTNRVLHEINLEIGRGNIVALVGPSGCGKSTLLRAIVGTHPPRQGQVLMHDDAGAARAVRAPGRDRGIVYQRYSLFPFLTAQQNVAMGLMLDQTSLPGRIFQFPAWRRRRKQHLAAAAELLEQVGLAQAIKLYPHEMSGGMRQRVAVAQALIMKPQILLLDEPFGALDEAMREELQRMLLRLSAENRAHQARGEPAPYTVFIVTHELNEAIYVGDRILGLSQYWNWAAAGHTDRPGATIVYDKAAPVYDADDPRDYAHFVEQREEIRHVVFDTTHLQDPAEHRHFWTDAPTDAEPTR